MLLPHYTRFMAPLWGSAGLTEQLDLGALAVAHDTLELVDATLDARETESRRRRIAGTRLRALLDGRMRALLDGEAQLPPLPSLAR